METGTFFGVAILGSMLTFSVSPRLLEFPDKFININSLSEEFPGCCEVFSLSWGPVFGDFE